YTWNGTTYTMSGTYTYSTTNAAGCDSTATLNLTIRNSSSSSQTDSACVSYFWPIDGNNYTMSGTYTHVEINGVGCTHTYTLNLTIYSQITASAATIGSISCYGGTVDVGLTISGGTPPYTVAENLIGLGAGSYTFNITDSKGCTGSASITITEPTQLVASAVEDSPINCFSESTCVTVSATGGTGTYTGTGTFCLVMAGAQAYTVTDANGCVSVANINVMEPPKIEVSFTTVSPSCGMANGSATANVSGGVPSYSYLWSNSQTTATATGLTPGTYTLTVTDANGCTKASNVTIVAGILPPPAPGAIMGSPGACRNTSGVVYSIAPVSTATSYNWYLPTGATGFSTGTSITLSFSSTYNGGFICVEAVNPCGTSTQSCMNIPVLSVKPAKPGPVIGPEIFCGPGIQTYSILPVPNATSYNWTVSGTGVTILSGQGTTSIQVSVPSTFGQGIVGVTAQNCMGVSAISSMYITGLPQHSSPLFGPGYVCAGTMGVNYSISIVRGTAYYDWEVMSGDMTVVSETDNTCIVNFGAGWTSGILRVTTYNACGGFSRDYNVRSTPTQPLSISGPSSNLCNLTGVTYAISPVAAATGYTWTVPAGVTIVNNTGTSIDVDFGPGFTSSGNICVTADNACGQSVARCYNVTARPPQSGAIQGPFSVCKSQTGVLYTIMSVAGATSYSWSITGGPTLVAGDTSSVVDFTTATASSATITINTQNACGLGSPTRLTVLVNLGCREAGSDLAESGIEGFSLYPNPSQGLVDLSLITDNESKVLLEIVDMPGQILSSTEQSLSKGMNFMSLDLTDFAKGIYFVNIRYESGRIDTKKLILE
ncbi:MAG TPA: T9SS type A sorting domain-containing protein, partial [Bacteroidia bacterium]|nr:T9SS type A sorting domain-containing protein [Bacteroidia bacterium]